MKRQLKRPVVYSLYAISFILLVGGIVLLGFATRRDTNENFEYVSRGILDYEEYVQVVTTNNTVIRPYLDSDIQIVKNYYDYTADAPAQQNSIIFYENTYIPSSGVSYSNGKQFDVVAIYDGKVIDVKEDDILGKTVSIEHSNGMISNYQSLSDVTVSKDDNVVKGQIIAKSSTSNISADLGNHLYFELVINGECVNPENYYGKSIDEI